MKKKSSSQNKKLNKKVSSQKQNLEDIQVDGDFFNAQAEGNIEIHKGDKKYYLDSKKPVEFKALCKKLKSDYIRRFDEISFATEARTFKMDEFFVRLALVKEEEIKQKEEETKELHRKESRFTHGSYEDIFKPKEPVEIESILEKSSRGDSSSALILGKAGIGKTTLARFISHQWAKGKFKEHSWKKIELVIYYELRDWNRYPANTGLWKAILQDIYSLDSLDELKVNSLPELLEKQKQKVLLILDGYDELKPEHTQELKKTLEKLTDTNLIVTSRPYNINKTDLRLNETFESVGFLEEDIQEYVKRYYEFDTEKSESLKKVLDENTNIKSLCHIPIILEIVCNLWRSNPEKLKSSETTTTLLYSSIVDHIFETACHEKNILAIKDKKEIFSCLGKIAYEGLLKGEIYIDGDKVKKSLSEIGVSEEFFLQSVQKSGFLRSRGTQKNEIANEHYFIHLSFQEYFSAYYLSLQDEKFITNFVRENKFKTPLQLTFWFLAGLLSEDNGKLNVFFAALKAEPKNLIDWRYEFVLQLKCLEEVKDIESVIGWDEIIGKLHRDFKKIIDYKAILIKTSKRIIKSKINNNCLTDVLLSLMQDNKYRLKAEVIDSLGEFAEGRSEIIHSLLISLNDRDHNIRYRTVLALEKLRILNKEVINSLFFALNDKDWDIRIKSAIILNKAGINKNDIPVCLISGLRNESLGIRQRTAEYLSKYLGSENIVIDALLMALGDKDSIVREYAVNSLIILGSQKKEFVNLFILNLKNEISFIRQGVLRILSKLNISNKNIINTIALSLNDNDFNVKIYAIQALFLLGVKNSKFLDYLVMATNNIEPTNRINAIEVLGNLGIVNKEITECLLSLLNDKDDSIRFRAVDSISKLRIKSKEVINALILSLRDESSLVRQSAAWNVGELGINDKEIVFSLITHLKGNDFMMIKQHTAKSLGKIDISNEDIKSVNLVVKNSRFLVYNYILESISKANISNKAFNLYYNINIEIAIGLYGVFSESDYSFYINSQNQLCTFINSQEHKTDPLSWRQIKRIKFNFHFIQEKSKFKKAKIWLMALCNGILLR